MLIEIVRKPIRSSSWGCAQPLMSRSGGDLSGICQGSAPSREARLCWFVMDVKDVYLPRRWGEGGWRKTSNAEHRTLNIEHRTSNAERRRRGRSFPRVARNGGRDARATPKSATRLAAPESDEGGNPQYSSPGPQSLNGVQHKLHGHGSQQQPCMMRVVIFMAMKLIHFAPWAECVEDHARGEGYREDGCSHKARMLWETPCAWFCR